MTLLSTKLLGDTKPHPASKVAQALKRAGVPNSLELERILALPRRPPPDLSNVPDLTPVFATPNGTMKLWPIQSWALLEAEAGGGLFGSISVGGGKTLVSLLLPEVFNSQQALLLIPPQLREQLINKDIPRYSRHFNFPVDRMLIMAYSELSSPRWSTILQEIKPDLVIADEAHSLRSFQSARSIRFNHFFRENPQTRFVGLSGTMTKRSLKDYAHLLRLALKAGTPLPRSATELADWCQAIDVGLDPMPPGALKALCVPEDGPPEDQNTLRKGFRRRLVETVGVVASAEDELGTSLYIQALYPDVPIEVQRELDSLRMNWAIGDDVLDDPIAVARVAHQLACGMYYRWAWPNDVKDWEWLTARSAWHKEVQEYLRVPKPGLDSPMLVAQAAAQKRIPSDAWPEWVKVKDRKPPPVETVWVSDFLVKETIKWAKSTCYPGEPGIIWYAHDSFGRRVAEEGGFPFFGPGEEASKGLANIDAKANPAIVCSIKAHGEGKNLQMYSNNLITTCPSSGLTIEQLIGRTHRPGQEADEVRVEIFMHTAETYAAFQQALVDAKYIEATQGQRQKLCYASILLDNEEEKGRSAG